MRKIRPEVRELVHHDLALRESDEAQALPAREHIVRKACSSARSECQKRAHRQAMADRGATELPTSHGCLKEDIS